MKTSDKPRSERSAFLSELLRTLTLAAIGLALGLNLYSFNVRAVNLTRLPMPFGFGAAMVTSGSMLPTIDFNDLTILRKADRYGVGDIVVFEDSGYLTMHRVVETEGDSLITRGDANNTDDPPITQSDVLGKVILILPYAGAVVRLVRTPTGILLLLLLAFWLLVRSFRPDSKAQKAEISAMKAEIASLKAKQRKAEQSKKSQQ